MFGDVTLGHTFRSADLRSPEQCEPIVTFYGHCEYHPYPAIDIQTVRHPVAGGAERDDRAAGRGAPEDPDAWPRAPGKFIVLELDHPQGDCRFFAYKHLARWAVSEGDRVFEGDVIGHMGNTQSPNVPPPRRLLHRYRGFQPYEAQADYGTIEWRDEDGQPQSGDMTTFQRGDRIHSGPGPASTGSATFPSGPRTPSAGRRVAATSPAIRRDVPARRRT